MIKILKDSIGIRFQDWGCEVFREIDSTLKICWFNWLCHFCGDKLLDTYMCKSQWSQSHESRTQSPDSSKPCSKPRTFICVFSQERFSYRQETNAGSCAFYNKFFSVL